MEENQGEMWAVVELMGHDVTAGIMRPCEIGGLMKLDVPVDDGFRTEFIGPGAVFRIRIVSEEIARVYARPERGIVAYDTPIVPREIYEQALQKARNENEDLLHKISVLSRRLTDINSLPAPEE
jgi:hypothetical protein